MNDTTPRYALSARTDAPFAEVDRRVRDALESEGFGVLTEIDVSATLAKKLDVEIPRYEILGACAPPLAYRALQLEPDIGLLLPCNVVVREDGGGQTVVEALDPVLQLGVTENEALGPLAAEVRARMKRVVAAAAAAG